MACYQNLSADAQEDLVDAPPGGPLGGGGLGLAGQDGVDLIPVGHEVVQVLVRFADGVVQDQPDVNEVLVAGQELAGRGAGGVEGGLGVVPRSKLADGPDRARQNWMRGGSATAEPPPSKNSRSRMPARRATKLDGSTCSLVLSSRTPPL